MATYSFVSQSQLDTIRAKVAPEQPDFAKTDRQRLKELSDDRAKQWPNTLQAQRERKERARLERMAAEESERVECDKREAELRAEQRRVQIERANKILFDETDRVKTFNSKLLLSDVIHENEALIGQKKQIEVLKRAQEQAFVEQQRQALEIAEQVELNKMMAIKQRSLEQRDDQLGQIEDLKTRIRADRASAKREGQVLKQSAIDEEEELKRKEQDRIARAKDFNMQTKQANEVLQTLRSEEQKRGKDQERAVEAYSKKKQEMLEERARREAERKAAADAHRAKIADHIHKSHTDKYSKIEQWVERDVAEADRKAAADEAERKQRLLDSIAAIDHSRKTQLAHKAEVRNAERHDDAQYAAAWAQRTRELRQEEEDEMRGRSARNRQVRDFQLHQAEIKARRMAKARIQELEDAAQIQLSLKEQEEIFLKYASLCIEEYRNQGKSTVPMELYLKKKPTLDTMG